MHNKARSQKREKQIATEIGGRAHIASGALWFRKADASNDLFLVEDKFTDANVYRVVYNTLLKLEHQALRIGKTPIFRFGFTKAAKDFILVRECDYNYPEKYDDVEIITVDGAGSSLSLTNMTTLMGSKSRVAKIKFNKFNRSYFLFDWDFFVDNQTDFTA